jgi:hypothetical protein
MSTSLQLDVRCSLLAPQSEALPFSTGKADSCGDQAAISIARIVRSLKAQMQKNDGENRGCGKQSRFGSIQGFRADAARGFQVQGLAPGNISYTAEQTFPRTQHSILQAL